VTPTAEPSAETLDLAGVPCPANTARALLRLELLDEGDLLAVIVDDGEPLANVPPSLTAEGHEVLAVTPLDGRWRVLVRKG
jgi:TusA-related sulfurtransferase